MPDYNSIFPLPNTWLLLLSFGLCIISLVLFQKQKYSWALISLFFTAFFLRLFMAHLDPFLHEWDERFHALVARNMMHDPFKPMLRASDWARYDYRQWSRNHIWLHKQPLFLWQMALSMKIFGVSAFAIRYPGVLMGSIGVIMIYRIALLMTANRSIAFLAALLTCFSYYPLEFMSGLFGMDMNDTAFSFYVVASLWAFAEYSVKKTLKFAVLIGFLSGCAILIKWLPGLLVFSGWGISILLNIKKENFKTNVIHYLTALVVCVVVFMPWQIYILHRFPLEAHFEYEYNIRRLHEAVDGRSGTWLFYINNFDLYFGQYLFWLLPAGLLLMLFLKRYHTRLSLVFALYFIIALAFFSLISRTMVTGYFLLVTPVGYIFMAIAIYHLICHEKVLRYLYIPAALLISFFILNLGEITNQHDPGNINHNNGGDWTSKRDNTLIYSNLRKYMPATVKVIFNAKDYEDVMFYNNDIDAFYSYDINISDLDKIKKQHFLIAAFNAHNEPLPDFIWSYDSIFIIKQEIK